MDRTIRRLAAIVAAVVLIGIVSAARADTLLSLINGGSITVGDKLFDNFTYLATGDMPAASAINVVGIGTGVGPDYYGIRFQGGFSDDVGNGGSDALITYDVTVLDPSYRITDAHLDSNLIVNGDPGGPGHTAPTPKGTITETFTAIVPPVPPLVGTFITNFNFDNVVTQLHDAYTWGLPGYTKLNVQKDIFLNATDVGTGDVGLSFVDQRYSQSVVPLPQAFAAGLSLLGVMGVKNFRRPRTLKLDE